MKYIISILILCGYIAISQIPQTLNYQGYLADSNGDPVNGSENITFRIYDVDNGGAALWTEARSVTLSDGVFSVVLGENTPINLPFDTQYWLGITVGGSELSPRTKLASATTAFNGNPPGVVLPYVGTSAPTGFLLCDGSAVSRTTYSALFSVIGTSYGSGDGATTFNLPDLRGRFMRGADNGSGNDPDAAGRTASNAGGNTGDNVGSLQGDAIRNMSGNFFRGGTTVSDGLIDGVFNNVAFAGGEGFAGGGNLFRRSQFNASNQVPTGSDNRPVNISFNYIIKY